MTMRMKALGAVLAMIAVAVVPGVASGATGGAGSGLWDSSTVPANQIDDSGSVELGVKFTTSEPVLTTGIRVYRVDSGAVTGSLWTSGGTMLATGTFEPQADDGWQDLVFASPVPIGPGQTYVASYFTPNADYAYEHFYFTNSALTVGPITALQSVEGDRNGVYCYVGESCGSFPTNSYRDSNYWVSPLWAYDFDGFYQPVDNGTWNKAKAGSAIPVKFSLGGDYGLDILQAGYPKVTPLACPAASSPTDPVEETVTAGGSGLTYDANADQYAYVWKTAKSWAGKCYRFELGLDDGTSHTFDVQFVK